MASLAGRPNFATNKQNSVSAQSQPQARYRQQPGGDSNAPPPPYNQARTAHAVQSVPQQMPIPLAAPKPGYVAPIAALNMSQLSYNARSPPGINSGQYGTAHVPPAVTRQRPPVAPISVPNSPHPLPPTMTPILPVFARPSKPSEPDDVKRGPESIMRGNSEEKLLPRRGENGDDFWRRFSMVAREESQKPSSQKQSAWLRKNQSGANRLSIWVWILGLIIFSCAGFGIGLGWYLSHKASPFQDPTAIGGHGNNGANSTTSPPPIQGVETGTGTATPHVTPTHTVAQRAVFPRSLPTHADGAPIDVMPRSHSHGSRDRYH
ncbi:hypothetical protein BGY98DRAFT_950063 [Russula aff. rugulosa BPL654]|nr:hypothetical protein BGY98DRAFT_950063 [Russula aff. rugulosa BPL654]